MLTLPEVITIDGQAHTGKSLAAFNLARELRVYLLNTGAMYRTVAYKLLEAGVNFDLKTRDPAQVEAAIAGFQFSMQGQQVTLNGVAIPEIIFDITMNKPASDVAKLREVRLKLQAEQKRIQKEHAHIITEGRDQGTAVFPGAGLKFFFTASYEVQTERAAMKKRELNPHEVIDLVALRNQVEARDKEDKARTEDPLRAAPGAVLIDTSTMNPSEVLAKLLLELDSWRCPKT
jgi:CMP/dCMP kinase